MLDEKQTERLATVTLEIQKLREEQRVLYAIRDGVFITEGEKTEQLKRVERSEVKEEATPSVEDVEAILEGKK